MPYQYAAETPSPSGAVISTSLDAATATTDATGYFDLKTNTVLNSACTPYTVTITAAGHSVWSATGSWGTSALGQVLTLSNPEVGPPSANCH